MRFSFEHGSTVQTTAGGDPCGLGGVYLIFDSTHGMQADQAIARCDSSAVAQLIVEALNEKLR